MQWKVVTDSGCDIPEKMRKQMDVQYESVAFSITEEKTSCPSPAAWLAAYEGAEQVIVVTMSGALSGSYRSAMVAREIYLEQHPERQIYILDSRSAGVGIGLQVQRLVQEIRQEKPGEAIIQKAKAEREQVQVLFALFHFDNLIKGGRMHQILGYAVNRLKICLIGAGSREGKIEILHKVRGGHRIYERLLKDMEERRFDGKTVMISHCFHRKAAEHLADCIRSQWPQVKVQIVQMQGICSYYAEQGGLMVAFRSEL